MTDTPRTIWQRPVTVDDLAGLGTGNMVGHLGIVFTEVGADYLRATMPVDERTRQPFGLLHGGASVALAETLGSVAAGLCIDPETHYCVGLEINANHLRSLTEGQVTGTARPLHLGSRTQVWEINVRDVAARLVCVSRLTLAVLSR